MEIKFKVWNGEKTLGPFDLSQNPIYWEGLEDGERLFYTGLKDKNGVEIYDKTKLKSSNKLVEVYWNKYIAGFDCKFLKFIKEENPHRAIDIVPENFHMFEVVKEEE